MLPMSSGAGEITHTSDLTSVKYLTAVKRIPCATRLIFFSSPSCIDSGDNKFTGEKRFFAEQIVPEIINFLFLSSNCIFNPFKQVVK
jgi:hypothetical protein